MGMERSPDRRVRCGSATETAGSTVNHQMHEKEDVMDSRSDMQNMTDEWLRMQKELLEQWSEAMRSAASVDGERMADQLSTTWQRAIEESTRMQRQWVRSLREQITSMDEVSSETAAGISNSADELESWLEVQERFWKEWVGVLRESYPDQMMRQGQNVAGAVLDTMQRGADTLIDITRDILGTRRPTGKS